jgi:ATP-binding cassette subfamily B protein
MNKIRLLRSIFQSTASIWWLDTVLTATTIGLFTVPALLTRSFFDALTRFSAPHLSLALIVAMLISSELVRIGVQFSSNLVRVLHRYRISSPLRERLLAAICDDIGTQLPSTGDVITRLRDDVDEVVAFSTGLCTLVGQAVYSLIAVIIMCNINARITLITTACVMIVAVIVRLGGIDLKRYRETSRDASAKISELLGEAFGAVQALQVAGAQRHVGRRLEQMNDARRAAIVKESIYGASLKSLNAQAATFASAAMLFLAATALRTGTFTVGDFALFNYFLGYLAGLPTSVADAITRYYQVGVSIDRLAEVVKNPETLSGDCVGGDAIAEPLQNLEHFEVKNLEFRYPGSSGGITGISFKAWRGSITVITGPVGCGKTTVLKCILGIQQKDSGEIYWNGRKVTPGVELTSPAVAYAPQLGQLFSETLQNNVLLGIAPLRLEDGDIARRSVLDADLAAMEDGWETQIGSRGLRLSGGQKQRVLAARMLIRDAELYLIDDISSALDLNTEHHLWQRIFEDQTKTFIIASNRLAVLERASNVVLLNRGSIVAQGAYNELAGMLPQTNSIKKPSIIDSSREFEALTLDETRL